MGVRLGLGAGVLAVVLGAASVAGAQTKLKLGDLAQSLNGIASNVMIQQGFDKKHGIAVEYTTYPTLDGLFTAIRGKQVDVGFGGWTAFAQFRSKGFPVTMIFPVGIGVTLDVIAPAGSDYKSLGDLKGKRVGSYAGAAGTATVLYRVLAKKFYDYDPVAGGNMQYAGPGLLPTLVERGDVQAALLFDPLAAKAVASGKFRSIANLADVYKEKVGDNFLWIGMASNDDYIARNPKALESFVKAWIDAVAYVKSHPEVYEAYGKKLNLDAKGIELLRNRVNADYTTEWNDQTIAALRKFATMANEVMGGGYLDTVPDASFTTRFVPKDYTPGK
jgi:NitT/TauT family transport system substrate-binding protein